MKSVNLYIEDEIILTKLRRFEINAQKMKYMM